jgi:hypothetical protein
MSLKSSFATRDYDVVGEKGILQDTIAPTNGVTLGKM